MFLKGLLRYGVKCVMRCYSTELSMRCLIGFSYGLKFIELVLKLFLL